MILFYDDQCPLCRFLSYTATLIRPGLTRLPLNSNRAYQYLKGFPNLQHQPYLLDNDHLYSGRKMVLRYLGLTPHT